MRGMRAKISLFLPKFRPHLNILRGFTIKHRVRFNAQGAAHFAQSAILGQNTIRFYRLKTDSVGDIGSILPSRIDGLLLQLYRLYGTAGYYRYLQQNRFLTVETAEKNGQKGVIL